MAVKTYQHAHGRLVSEKTTGGSRKDYLTDALGSVTYVTDTSGNTLETIRNAAYGKRVSGAAPTVTRTWVGTWGYAQTGLLWADVSLPYRHYSSQTTRWTTRDVLWPRQFAFSYCLGRPTGLTDRFGLNVGPPGPVCPPPSPPSNCVECSKPWNAYIYALCNCPPWGLFHDFVCAKLARDYYFTCGKQGKYGMPGMSPFRAHPRNGRPGEVYPDPPPRPSLSGGRINPSIGKGHGGPPPKPIEVSRCVTPSRNLIECMECCNMKFIGESLELCHHFCESYWEYVDEVIREAEMELIKEAVRELE